MHIIALVLALAAAPHGDSALAARIRARIAQVPGAQVGVAFAWPGHGDSLYLDADSSFHAASTMKLPVMIELFRQVDAGALSLDQRVLLVNEFGSIVDGSRYALDPGDDSDSALYALTGRRVSVGELLQHMIDRSSNLATNALIALVGAHRTTAAMRTLGAVRIQVLRGVEDLKAYDRGLDNTTTARDLAIILQSIQDERAASPRSCDMMRSILLHQEFNDEIPAGLPPGTPVAHKTGWITAHLHDAAIVYPRGVDPYVLVVLTRAIPDEKVARALIQDISRMVYAHVMASGSAATR